MTIVRGTLLTPDRTPLMGWVDISVNKAIPTGDTVSGAKGVIVPTVTRETLVGGFFLADLEPSIAAKATYTFKVYEDTGSGTFRQIGPTIEASIPDQAVLEYEDLQDITGIYTDVIESRYTTIAARLYTDSAFWSTLNSQLFKRRGGYNPGALYTRGDVVEWEGCGWLWVWPTNGNVSPVLATDAQGFYISGNDRWILLGSRGQTGTGTTGNNTPFGVSWDNQTDAPSRNAVYDQLQLYVQNSALAAYAPRIQPALQEATNTMGAGQTNLALNNPSVVNAQWVQSVLDQWRKGFNPVGTILAFAGTTAPSGWLLCEGQVLLRADYPALFTVLGTLYNIGGEGITTFRLPDLRGRTALGVDGGAGRVTGATANGVTGGQQSFTLAPSNMPAHSHTMGNATGVIGAVTDNSGFNIAFTTPGNFQWYTGTGSQGSSAPVTHITPYQAIRYIIYTGV